MKELKIEYEDGRFIEVQLDDYLFFLGGHNKWKRKIIRTLKRFSMSKNLNELEEGIYGNNGIEVYYDNKQLKSRTTNLLFLEDNSSIYNQLSFIKDNLMYRELVNFQHAHEVTRRMETLNDEILQLEVLLNNKLEHFSDSISIELGHLEFKDVLKNNLILTYQSKNQIFPLEMMNSSELLDEYLLLLRYQIDREEEMIWLTIINPESFLDEQSIKFLFSELKKIASETKQLKFFIFSNNSLPLEYTSEDISKTVLLFEDYQQMPEFELFYESISRHYPDKLTSTEHELTLSFYRICNFIGLEAIGTYYLNPKDMVLLKVMKNLLQIDTEIETSIEELTQLEEAFLNNHKI